MIPTLNLPAWLTDPNWGDLYQDHLGIQQQRLESVLQATGHDGLLIVAGEPGYYYGDDIARPFRAYAHFLSWLPLTRHPGCCLWLRPGHKPVLFYRMEAGFWHLPPQRPQQLGAFWVEHFEIHNVSSADDIKAHLKDQLAATAYLGENEAQAADWGLTDINPGSVCAALDWYRGLKTAYEQACIYAASRIAVSGHRAAAQAFAQGQGEYAIHLAYLQATGMLDEELPYPNIIGLNEHGSVLHYQHRDRGAPPVSRSLLIDAGASFHGYGSDITRSYSRESGLFYDLVLGVDQVQQALVESISGSRSYVDLHRTACLKLAELLQNLDVVRMSPEQQLEEGVITRFFPHGLGHLLGLQVHDVSGRQGDISGTPLAPPPEHPLLRFTRPLEPGMVFTVEPGIYFIDSLLEPLRHAHSNGVGAAINWTAVYELRPFGGVRIEDDVLLADDGPLNLSRSAFAEMD